MSGIAETPLVSVVIPVMDRREIMLRCLCALGVQEFAPFEVIIVDDGSTDGTVVAVRECMRKFSACRISVFELGENKGANAARNYGISRAQGRYVAFIDSDCIPEPGWLANAVACFDDLRVAAVVGTVTDIAQATVYERLFAGTCRVHGRPYPRRIVSSNLFVKREFLLQYPLDEDIKYGCNEEGLYLKLKACGCVIVSCDTARVDHYHPYTYAGFVDRAAGLGRAAAWLVYKYYLPPRIDLVPFMAGYGFLLLGMINHYFFLFAGVSFLGAFGALAYNEHARKGKTIRETVLLFPVLLLYYHIRLYAYVRESIRLHFFPNTVRRVDLKGIRYDA